MLRRYLLIASIAALWPLSAFAQTINPVPTNGTLVVANDAVTASPNDAPSVLIQVTGTWTGTITFRASGDGGVTYVDVLATAVTDGSMSTTTTANGGFAIFNPGYDAIRAILTTAATGRANVIITRGYAQAKLASPQFSNVVANSFCMSASTKDSYFAEVGANNPGAYTNGTNCAGGTLRWDWNASRLNLLFGQGIASTSTDSLVIANATAATGGATVQMSPRLRFRGNAWDTAASETVDFFLENLPATAATPIGTLKFGYSLNGAAPTYPMTLSSAGNLAVINNLTATGGEVNGQFLKVGIDTGYLYWNTRNRLSAPADGQFNLTNAAASAGIGLDVSTDSTIKIRTRAQSGYGTVDALAYNASGTAGITGTCDTPTFTGGVATTCGGSGGSVDGTYFVTGNFTTAANTNLQTITGLTWTFPANTAINSPFRCSLVYSQATAAVADSIGIQDVTVAPTNAMFASTAETTLTAVAFGDLTAFSSTTATAVNTFTPGAIGTTYKVSLDGLVEQPSNASTSAFNVMIKTSASGDVITVYRGSYCKVG